MTAITSDRAREDERIREIKRELGQLGNEIHSAEMCAPRSMFPGKYCRKNPRFRFYEAAKHLPYELRRKAQALTEELKALRQAVRLRHGDQPAPKV
jgi:hypothetical protein